MTTKRSSTFEKTKVSYSGNFQFEKVNHFLDYQNGWGTGENSYLLDHKLTLQPNGNRLQTDLPNFSGYNSSAGAKLRSWGAAFVGFRLSMDMTVCLLLILHIRTM